MNSNNRVNSKNYLKDTKNTKMNNLHREIMNMKGRELTDTLKAKALPVFGTLQQKRDRLKNYYGLENQTSNTKIGVAAKAKKDTTREAIDKINQNREKRRQKMEEKKQRKIEKAFTNQELGIK